MGERITRRTFVKGSLLPAAGGMLAIGGQAAAQTPAAKAPAPPAAAAGTNALPTGKIGNLTVSRMLLGGNLLTHYTHSRDLRYVYDLTAHYNTDEKIIETLALAEAHGVNTLSVHTVPRVLETLKKHRANGGKMQWIICPTARLQRGGMGDYSKQVEQLVKDGTDAIYLWGVHADRLVARGEIDVIAEAVKLAKDAGVPSGVGGHDLRVVVECEKHNVGADFYIKTFHHHKYPTGPKPEEIKGPYREIPGYWCADPAKTIEVMKAVTKPWIAFKVMAAGAIPPASAFSYAFNSGADHLLAGMFDFEIAEDARLVKDAIAKAKRDRPWRS